MCWRMRLRMVTICSWLETVEELAHPPDVGLPGQVAFGLQHVDPVTTDPVCQTRSLYPGPGQGELLRQIQNGDAELGIPGRTGEPTARVAPTS